VINDLLGVIIDRFNSIHRLSADIRDQKASILGLPHIYVYYDKSLLINIVFYSDKIKSFYDMRDHSKYVLIGYDELTDIDVFIGLVFCKVFSYE